MTRTTHTTKSTTITEMVGRYAELDRAYLTHDKPPAECTDSDKQRMSEIGHELADLEPRIVATQATTRAELAAKCRFIKKTHFVTPGHHGQAGDLDELVEMILAIDAARVGVGKASSTIATRPQATADTIATV
jgi:hypothetical protein